MQRYCVYQDRCHQEIRSKLIDHQVYGDDLEHIIIELIKDNFLNEERFAKAYVSGKYKIKRWGRMRLKQELKRRAISEYCIRKAMQEIDEDVYKENLHHILSKKWNGTSTSWTTRKQLTQHAISKGYEYEIIGQTIASLWRQES